MRKFKASQKNFSNSLYRFASVGLLVSSLQIGCEKQELTDFLTSYAGSVERDVNGSFYRSSRITVGVNNSVTREQVEQLIKEFDGRISGYSTWPDTSYDIDLPADQRELAIQKLRTNPEIRYATRNYYNTLNYDNDILSGKFSDKKEIYKCSTWYKVIKLSEGLDIVQEYLTRTDRKLPHTTLSIFDTGFDITNSQLNWSAPAYRKAFTKDIISNNIVSNNDSDILIWGRFLDPYNHSMEVSLIAAAVEDGYRTNGVASAGRYNFDIMPIAVGSWGIYLEDFPFHLVDQSIYDGSTIEGLKHTYTSTEVNPVVVNMSYGHPVSLNNDNPVHYDKLVLAIKSLAEKKIIPVAAAGNEKKDARTHSPSGIEGVIAVASTDWSLDEKGNIVKETRAMDFSNYSNNPKYVTISAPGFVAVPTAGFLPYAGNLEHPEIILGNDYYRCEKGTSMSSPMVAGTVALIKALKPDADYYYVVKLLRDNADTFVIGADDPIVEARGQTIYRLNVYKTMKALIKDLDKDNPNGQIPPQCKQYDRFIEDGKMSLDMMDAYGPMTILHSPNAIGYAPTIYNFDTGEISSIPIDKMKYESFGDISLWENEVIIKCAPPFSTSRMCRYVINGSEVELMTNVPAAIVSFGLLNYWNGTVTYAYSPDTNPQRIFSHDYKSARPINGITIPKLSSQWIYYNLFRGFFNSTAVFLQTDDPFDHLFFYDSKNGLVNISEYKTRATRFSQHNTDFILFADENNNLFKLDFTSRAISPINIPASEIAFGADIEYDNGKLATYSSSDPRTIYVWDVAAGKKTFEMKLPNDSSVQNGKGFVLKGGVLTVHTSGNFRKDKTYSGTRTYSCPIK